ncbi:MarR family winged helix-turn-helix transcriptional regulator [Salinarimonas ramus]|uniref:HTH marR-type domain-containing protein n=1 Tax=Salinarimonas ramus TaxID=690164 RepID=A0A917V209_9HYPH|nr:MarR family transcriptional regulator [Salinarimonas ramus]GGK17911.1 hypothetical protein GCM10011322_00790 [Salinarimonas ramus]
MTNDERLRFVPAQAYASVEDMRAAEIEDEIHALTTAMRVIAQAIDTRSKAVSRVSGLTIPQIVVMQAVATRGEVTTSLLSRHCHLSAGTVVSILDKLEERGFVERYRNAADRRIVHTRLTASGESALADAPTLLPPVALDGLARLSSGERRAIVSSFEAVAGLLRADGGVPG